MRDVDQLTRQLDSTIIIIICYIMYILDEQFLIFTRLLIDRSINLENFPNFVERRKFLIIPTLLQVVLIEARKEISEFLSVMFLYLLLRYITDTAQ